MKITVVGYGIVPKNDLTLRGLQVMKSSTKTLVVGPTEDVRELNKLDISAESIFQLYGNGDADMNNYLRIYAYVLKVAREVDDVVLAVPGHPGVGVTLIQMLMQRQAEDGFEIELIAGISSFAWMILENLRDPIERGTSLVDANRLLLLDLDLDPTVDLYIYHVCSVGTARVWIQEPKRDNHIQLLKEKLLKTYPEDHKVELISATGQARFSVKDKASPAAVVSATVGTLDAVLNSLTFDCTLFLRGLQPKRINQQFLKLIQGEV